MTKDQVNNPRIFISYSSKDRDVVEELHKQLETAGFDVWRDQTHLETDWSREIADELAKSDMVCLMWSEHAAASKWVKHEWLTARALEKRIIPFLFSGAPDLPVPLNTIHRIDAKGDNLSSAIKTVVERLEKITSYVVPYDYTVLPPNSYIPFNPNSHFTGRHTDLLDLYLKMVGNLNKIGINQVGTVGMGGIGKTQLAVEFAYRFSFYFERGGIYWIQANDTKHWIKEFVTLARDRLKLTISDPEGTDKDSQYIEALRNYFDNHRENTLIVMDNVADPLLLNNENCLLGIAPLNLGCNLLFTTRRNFQIEGVDSQPLDVLSEDASYQLLTDSRNLDTPENQSTAYDICATLGYLPLAITLASGFLKKRQNISFQKYLNILNKDKLSTVDKNKLSPENLATRHSTAVEVTLREQWEALLEEDTKQEIIFDVQQLFKLAGHFSESEIIPEARLRLLAGLPLASDEELEDRLEESIILLNEFKLIERLGHNSIRLHPLMHEFAFKLTSDAERQDFKFQAGQLLKKAYFDYCRLERELQARSVQELLDDLQIAIDWWSKDIQGLQELNLLQSALRLSANQLTRDYRQLASHLIGRLKNMDNRNLQQLAIKAKAEASGQLLLYSPSLILPGGPLQHTLEGHSDWVNSVTITPDGKRAISASDDKTLNIWDIQSGALLHTLEGHSDWVNAVSVTPDGKRAISASEDKTLNIWDIQSGDLLHILEGHSLGVNAVAITTDGKRAISASGGNTLSREYIFFRDFTLKIWDIQSGALLHTLEGHRDWVNVVTVTPDGKRAVSASRDKTLKVWDIQSGTLLHTLEGHSGEVTAVTIASDSKSAIAASDDNTLKVWDIKSGELSHTLESHSNSVTAVVITPDCKRAISASRDSTLKVWDIQSGALLHTLDGHSDSVTAVEITPDCKRIISASGDNSLKVWDIQSGTLLHTLEGHSDSVSAVAITPDGKGIVSASGDKSLKMWDIQSIALLLTLDGHSKLVKAVAITPDGRRAITASEDSTLKVWDIQSGALLHTLEGHSHDVTAVAIVPDGKRAISTSYDSTLKVWDIQSGALLHTLEGHSGSVSAVAITPDGKRAISASWEMTLKVWDIQSGALLHTLNGHSNSVTAVAIIPDGKRAISASGDSTLKVWDIQSGALLHTLEGHSLDVNAVAIIPDGKRAISASYDSTLKVWDIQSGALLHTLGGHNADVAAVVITPDGKGAISASWDSTLKVWDIQSGALLHTLEGHSRGVYAVAITPDGKRAISASWDGTLKVWDILTGKEIFQFIGESSIIVCALSLDGKSIVAGEQSGSVHFLRLSGVG